MHMNDTYKIKEELKNNGFNLILNDDPIFNISKGLLEYLCKIDNYLFLNYRISTVVTQPRDPSVI